MVSKLFPDRDRIQLSAILRCCDGDVTAAAEQILTVYGSKNFGASSWTVVSGSINQPSSLNVEVDRTSENLTPFEILRAHRSRTASIRHVELIVRRDQLWRSALSFYKNCIHNVERLLYGLRIEFEGEEGVDAGALKLEFFECLLQEMDEQLFEGDPTRRVPKRNSNIDKNFQSAGMMIGHSIMQGGPSFSCLCPAVYSFILFGDKELALEELPSVDDIPKNAATAGIIGLIHEVSYFLCTSCKYLVCVYSRVIGIVLCVARTESTVY